MLSWSSRPGSGRPKEDATGQVLFAETRKLGGHDGLLVLLGFRQFC